MNVEQIATVEEEWLNKQRSLVGDREVLYERDGIYAAWRRVFGQYMALAREGDLEALKRAVFFVWAECSMGHLMTGIRDLDRETVRETLAIADELARDARLDAELQWMLSYYYLVEPSYIEQFEGFEALRRVSQEGPFLYRQACLDSSFDNRGHMGEYWKGKQAILRQWPYPRPDSPLAP